LAHEAIDIGPFVGLIAGDLRVFATATAANKKGVVIFYYHIVIVHDIIIA
jgi:hypothetical protein